MAKPLQPFHCFASPETWSNISLYAFSVYVYALITYCLIDNNVV